MVNPRMLLKISVENVLNSIGHGLQRRCPDNVVVGAVVVIQLHGDSRGSVAQGREAGPPPRGPSCSTTVEGLTGGDGECGGYEALPREGQCANYSRSEGLLGRSGERQIADDAARRAAEFWHSLPRKVPQPLARTSV